MSVCQQAYKQILDKMLLPYDNLVHFHRDDVHKGTLFLNPVIQFFNVDVLHN